MSSMVSGWNKIRKLSKSELRDTLVKEYNLSKEALRAMGKKELQSQLAGRIIRTIKRLLDEMKKANVQALFGQALEREKDKKKRKALMILITMFSEELLPEWRKAI
jgi:hypothetical protein